MKAGAQEPGPQVFHVPTIERQLPNVIAVEQPTELMGDVFV